ncbi:DoxX family protein [Actinomadura keratinilytica]
MTGTQLAFLAVTLLTAAVNIGMAAADLLGARFVLANSAEVGVPRSWLPRLAALKLAGAAGLLLGLCGAALRPSARRRPAVLSCSTWAHSRSIYAPACSTTSCSPVSTWSPPLPHWP